MAEVHSCVAGDGGPLVVLQATAIPQWQGANDFGNSLMNGGNVETDYDIICGNAGSEDVWVVNRYGRDMLVLWDSEEGASLLPPHLLSLSPETLVLTLCYADDDLPSLLPEIVERVRRGEPERSLLFHIQDTMLRLQVGADSHEPSYIYPYVDMPVAPGMKRCDVYLVENDSLAGEIVIIGDHKDDLT